jgi:zinc transport system substrate-binding protein
MVRKIVAALSDIDARHRNEYLQSGNSYLGELKKLDRQIRSTISLFKTKKYVAFHPAWAYFARRYGLEPAGIIEEAPGRNPTPRHIKKIIDQIKAHEIRAVFAEPQLNPKVAEVVAHEANVKVLLLDPIGDPKLKAKSTYLDLMRYNLKVLVEAMM